MALNTFRKNDSWIDIVAPCLKHLSEAAPDSRAVVNFSSCFRRDRVAERRDDAVDVAAFDDQRR